MARLKVKTYTELNNIKENEEYFAIKDNNVIKYIDFANNKMIIDMQHNIITRENSDYIYKFNFIDEKINIYVKNIKKEFIKEIKTILLEKTSTTYLVRYQLVDENIINEYYIKY